MFLDIVLDIISYGTLILLFTGAFFAVVYYEINKRKRLKVEQVGEKYTPMAGKFYLRMEKDTGHVLKEKLPENMMIFDTYNEAVVILESYARKLERTQNKQAFKAQTQGI